MTKDLLANVPHVSPLLARFEDKSALYTLARDKNAGSRRELTDIMVDLLEIPLNARETELLTDVIVEITRQAEKDLKYALAERLSGSENVPLRMILNLINDDILIAEPLLRESPVLEDMDLVYLIKSHTAEYWHVISQRPNLGPNSINALAETHDEETAVNLAKNEHIILTDKAISIFVEMSKESEELARPLLMRDELPGIIGEILYEYVGEEIKKIIRDRFPVDYKEAEGQIDDIVMEFVEKTDFDKTPTLNQINAAQRLAEYGNINFDLLVRTLRRGQAFTFTALLAEYAHLPHATVQDIMSQKNGQGLAIIAKAMDFQKADFMTLFMLTRKISNGAKALVDQNDITKAAEYFERLDKFTAQQILKESRH